MGQFGVLVVLAHSIIILDVVRIKMVSSEDVLVFKQVLYNFVSYKLVFSTLQLNTYLLVPSP